MENTTTTQTKTRPLTISTVRRFLRCPKEDRYTRIDGYAAVREEDFVRFGSLVHEACEVYLGFDYSVATDHLERTITQQAVCNQIGEPVVTNEDWPLLALARATMRAYIERWFADDTARWQYEAVERAFSAPLINPDTWKPSVTWHLAGVVDAIVKERATGKRFVLERKTTSVDFSDPSGGYWQRLDMDSQLSAYVIGAEAMGLAVDSTMYDVIRRPLLRPAKATPVEARKFTVAKWKQCPACKKKPVTQGVHSFTASGDNITGLDMLDPVAAQCEPDPDGGPRRICTDRGGQPYANTRLTDETPSEYEERVYAAIKAEPDAYFVRREVTRNDREIERFMRDFWAAGRIIREAELAGRAPRNPFACERFGAMCPYFLACSMEVPLDSRPDLWTKVGANPELERTK